MSPLHPLLRLALIASFAAGSVSLASAQPATASKSTAPADAAPKASGLNSELFYQLMLGELSAQNGESETAYGLMLDAARKSKEPRLFERAIDIALRARKGEWALEAANAWLSAIPSSKEANRYVLQILIGLNKIADTLEPAKRELASFPPKERAAAIGLLPRYYGRAGNRALAAKVVEQALTTDLQDSRYGAAAWSAVGSLRLMAGDAPGALEAAGRAAAMGPTADEPVVLALNLMDTKVPAAEALVRQYLKAQPNPDVRMAYTRKLLDSARYAEAYTQMQALTAEKPDYADAWLIRGSLEQQDKKLMEADTSLKRYVGLVEAKTSAANGNEMGRGLVQAYLLLAQIAEQNNKLDEANAYLKKIDSPQDAARVQSRRAMILSRQGKLDEAITLVRGLPETQPEEARAKINAELQLLRDAKRNAEAYALLTKALERFPNDPDLMYDQALLADKLNKLVEMEQLLRKVIALKPDFHHAYNALGYSLADRNLRLPEARALIKKALEFAPNDPYIIDSLAWVEYRSGNAQEAQRLLQGAYSERPDAEIAAHLGEVLWKLGQREQANAIWKEGLSLSPHNETLLETIRRLRGAL
jgi:tetratricopeptide (TPR) repeat protein